MGRKFAHGYLTEERLNKKTLANGTSGGKGRLRIP